MKWISARSKSGHESYELLEDNRKLLRMTINPEIGTARIETNRDKRLFLLRKEGFFKNKCVLRNEYGVKIGKVTFEHAHPESGLIEMNDKILHYTVEKNGQQQQLTLYQDSKLEPLVTCALFPNKANAAMNLIKSGMSSIFSSLLMTLCWYETAAVSEDQALELSL